MEADHRAHMVGGELGEAGAQGFVVEELRGRERVVEFHNEVIFEARRHAATIFGAVTDNAVLSRQ